MIYNKEEYTEFFKGDRKSAYISKAGKAITVTHSGGTIRELKVSKANSGYLRVSYGFIHIIVARTFIPNPENKPQVNHIDGDTQNNKLENLEWCTNSENGQHAHNTGLNKTRKGYKNSKESNRRISEGMKLMHKNKRK